MSEAKALKVFFSCTGVGILNRGIESFFREAFDGLVEANGLDIILFKGAGRESAKERVLWNLPRTGRAARFFGACLHRNSYVAEQLSSFPSMIQAIRKHRPEVIFYSDSNLGFQLFRWRKHIGVPFRLLFSNGGPCSPPFTRTDCVHQVAPSYLATALAAGESPKRHYMVPYGIAVPDGEPSIDEASKHKLRAKLGLPQDRQVILSVGWIAARHKRMDYLVREVASIPNSRPYLVMLGAMDETSADVVALATDKLGKDNFTARSVPYRDVGDYYRSADLFALASLKEGFGRVFLEALIHGLPVVAHDYPVMKFVLGDQGHFVDLSREGSLADAIPILLGVPMTQKAGTRRRESVRARFSWPNLAPLYREMFFDCARTEPAT